MTEQLIANLARIGELRVISRASVMRYKDARTPWTTVARELQVDAIIEGSVVRAADMVRVTARLIHGISGEIIWAQNFERDQRDVLALQNEVSRTIISTIDITLTPQEQALLASAQPVDPEIHRQVLLGRHHAAKATEESLHKAVQFFDLAIAKDPANAPAHAGLADAYMGLNGFYMHPREAMPKAKQAAEIAVSLDGSHADAHAALGFIHLVYDWDGPAAEKALLRALNLNPTLATARLHYAAYLTTQARHQEAVREIRRAVEFDPMSIRTNSIATSLLIFAQRYDDPMPDHDSGHAVQGGVAAEILKQVFDTDDIPFTACSTTVGLGRTCGDPTPALRSYSSFSQAADENAVSRIYIGIHFRRAVEEGVQHGRKIAAYAVHQFLKPVR